MSIDVSRWLAKYNINLGYLSYTHQGTLWMCACLKELGGNISASVHEYLKEYNTSIDNRVTEQQNQNNHIWKEVIQHATGSRQQATGNEQRKISRSITTSSRDLFLILG